MGPIVLDKHVKCHDHGQTVVPPEAVGGVICGHFSNVDNFRQEVDSDVISSVVVDPTSMNVHVV